MTSSNHVERLIAARDNEEQELTDWEEKFIRSCIMQLDRKGTMNGLSEKQVKCLETIEGIIQNGRNKAP